MKENVENALKKIKPSLQADGGDVELVEVNEDGVIKVKLTGTCAGCPMSQMTLKMGIEKMLKEEVPGVKVYLKPSKIKRQIRLRKKEVEKYRLIFKKDKYMETYYESLQEQRNQELMTIMEFLNVKTMKLPYVNLKKLNPESLSEIIGNYREITSELKNSKIDAYVKKNVI